MADKTLPKRDVETLLASLLALTETRIVPLTQRGVSSGSKVFGAAILSSANFEPFTVATNDEWLSPLLHGEINCIQQFFAKTHLNPSTCPSPRTDCIFFATHEPCSLCLSGIAWSGFREVYYLFTYEDSRDLFAIPHDVNILEQVFRVRAEGETDDALGRRELYKRTNKFFTARSLGDLVEELPAEEKARWKGEMEGVKGLYSALSDVSGAQEAWHGEFERVEVGSRHQSSMDVCFLVCWQAIWGRPVRPAGGWGIGAGDALVIPKMEAELAAALVRSLRLRWRRRAFVAIV